MSNLQKMPTTKKSNKSTKSSKLENEYSEISIQVTKELSKEEKKAHGIFITPKTIIQCLGNRVLELLHGLDPIQRVLEPSCATGEFIHFLENKLTGATIHGVELNHTIFSKLDSSVFVNNQVSFYNHNFLDYVAPTPYDLCIGNPPYVVLKKDEMPERFKEYSVGRPNLFGLFIIHSLSMLTENGILAFVVPSSFLNSAYYAKIRQHIKLTCNILDIIDFKETKLFIDTSQDTFGLIIKKTSLPSAHICPFSYKLYGLWVFTSNSLKLRDIFEGSTTLQQMGCYVKTGNVVWNQHKERLTESSDKTVLLYNSNLTSLNTIELKNFQEISQNKVTAEEKAQYIDLNGSTIEIKKGCSLVVNRGNGNSKYKLNYAIIPSHFPPYVAENHLNVIDTVKADMPNNEKMEIFNKIVKSFQNPRTIQFIDMFLGNNGLSKTELETIFPIYLD